MSGENVRPGDIGEYLAQPSEPEVQLRRLFRPSERLLILDIGACEAEDSIRYARRYPRSTVIAFEPLPANLALARINLERYGASNVELVPVALSDRPGSAEFHVSSGRPPELFAGADWNYGNKSSSLLQPASDRPMFGWVEFNETITVPTETLDGFCARRGIGRIDFIQMDVQGAEHLVLAGAERTLPRVTAIWLEVSNREHYRGQPLAKDIARWMHARGFRLAHQVYRGDASGEGDHLYLNRRRLRSWRHRCGAAWRRLRGGLARHLR